MFVIVLWRTASICLGISCRFLHVNDVYIVMLDVNDVNIFLPLLPYLFL